MFSRQLTRGKFRRAKYPEYLYPEIEPFFNSEMRANIQANNEEDFYKNRMIGENEHYICQLIRNDSMIDFITYITQKNIPIDNHINYFSIFETNSFLIQVNPCFHNDFSNYIIDNCLDDSTFLNSKETLRHLLENFNFFFLDCNMINFDIFNELCLYSHTYLLQLILKGKNINGIIISNKMLFMINY